MISFIPVAENIGAFSVARAQVAAVAQLPDQDSALYSRGSIDHSDLFLSLGAGALSLGLGSYGLIKSCRFVRRKINIGGILQMGADVRNCRMKLMAFEDPLEVLQIASLNSKRGNTEKLYQQTKNQLAWLREAVFTMRWQQFFITNPDAPIKLKLAREGGSDKTIRPREFLKSFDKNFTEVQQGWQKLVEASSMAAMPPQEAFSEERLYAMRAQLRQCGASVTYVALHPLYENPHLTWGVLETLRQSDPVMYLDLVKTYRDDENIWFTNVSLIGIWIDRIGKIVARVDRLKARGITETKWVEALAEVEQHILGFRAVLAKSNDIDSLFIQAERVVIAYRTLLRLKKTGPKQQTTFFEVCR
ncbi:MAG: hypothetical protein Q7T03_00255 [Deltaproteobacteria bacterium]|nr:hypothetical protein [Deltaproteobacteria bacterium]